LGAYDKNSEMATTTVVNEKLCGEFDLGVYMCEIPDWNRCQSEFVHIENQNLA
jgi:hypothetical protein